MTSFARQIRRYRVVKDFITIGNNTYMVLKRKVNGGNAKRTKGRKHRHPNKAAWVILQTTPVAPDGVSGNQ